MPKQLFKKITPHPEKIKNHQSLKYIQHLLHEPNIWYYNRRSVSRAFLVGIFCAFIPVPFQMFLAAILSIFLSANIALSIVLVWVTNPLTMGPIFYSCYKLGCYILNTPEFSVNLDWSLSDIYEQIFVIWKPLWLGSLIIGSLLAITSSYLIKLLWYLAILNRIRIRS